MEPLPPELGDINIYTTRNAITLLRQLYLSG